MCALNQHITIVIVIVVIVNTTTTNIFIIKRRRRSRGGVSDFGTLVSLYLFFSTIIITSILHIHVTILRSAQLL